MPSQPKSCVQDAIRDLESRLATLDSDETLNADPALKERYREALVASIKALSPVEKAWQDAVLAGRQDRQVLIDAWREAGVDEGEIIDRLFDLRPIPEYGHHMPIEEFVECCGCGGFTDYDGYGNYATADQMSGRVVVPSQVFPVFCNGEPEGDPQIEKGWTHVVWFNR
jgi:hypothetical protein